LAAKDEGVEDFFDKQAVVIVHAGNGCELKL
jgi:hypothetical protein